jgi:hypothetical protein
MPFQQRRLSLYLLPTCYSDATVREENEGTLIRTWINGEMLTDCVDKERRFGPGHVAIEHGHAGSTVSLGGRGLRVSAPKAAPKPFPDPPSHRDWDALVKR